MYGATWIMRRSCRHVGYATSSFTVPTIVSRPRSCRAKIRDTSTFYRRGYMKVVMWMYNSYIRSGIPSLKVTGQATGIFAAASNLSSTLQFPAVSADHEGDHELVRIG